MIPAFGIRLNRHDAVCDRNAIYIDGTIIAFRPPGLSSEEWDTLCRFICGEVPTVDWLTPAPAPESDPACWARLEAYMAPSDATLPKMFSHTWKKGRGNVRRFRHR